MTTPAQYTVEFVPLSRTHYSNVVRFVFDGEWIADFQVCHFFGDGKFRREDFKELATANGLCYKHLYARAIATAAAHVFVAE